MEPKCTCPILGPHEVCNFCKQVKYIFNIRTFKFCLKSISVSIQDHIVNPFQYFKRMSGCQPFFAWNKDLQRINTSESYNFKQTD